MDHMLLYLGGSPRVCPSNVMPLSRYQKIDRPSISFAIGSSRGLDGDGSIYYSTGNTIGSHTSGARDHHNSRQWGPDTKPISEKAKRNAE